MKRFFIRFKQFGGMVLVKEYVRKGVLFDAIGQFLLVILRRKTLGQADAALRRKIAPKLREEFLPVLKMAAKKYDGVQLEHKRSIRSPSVSSPSAFKKEVLGATQQPTLRQMPLRSFAK